MLRVYVRTMQHVLCRVHGIRPESIMTIPVYGI